MSPEMSRGDVRAGDNSENSVHRRGDAGVIGQRHRQRRFISVRIILFNHKCRCTVGTGGSTGELPLSVIMTVAPVGG